MSHTLVFSILGMYFLEPVARSVFLHFGQFYFCSRRVCNKRLANWTVISDTLTMNGFKRNAKYGFNSWKWSNLAWDSSSSLTIYFSILSLCGLQLPLRETPWFSFRHWETNLWFRFTVVAIKSPWWPVFPLRCANTQNYQSIWAVKSHSCAPATFQIWYRIYIA